MLAAPEDHVGLARALAALHRDPKLFLRLSRNAAQRVREQRGYEQTIAQEPQLIGASQSVRPEA